jgi:hypothetical protein
MASSVPLTITTSRKSFLAIWEVIIDSNLISLEHESKAPMRIMESAYFLP